MSTLPFPARLTDAQNRPTGVALALGLTTLVLVSIVGAWIARSVFFVAAGLLLVLIGYSAVRWPRATLVGAVLATLADPYVVRGLIPEEMHFLVSGFSEALIVVVGAAVVVRAVRARTFVGALRDPVLWLALLFGAVAVLSALLNGIPPLVAALGIFVTVDALAIYFLVRMLPFTARSAALAMSAFVAAATLAAVIGMAQAFLTPEILWFQAFAGRFGEGGRVSGFLGNPNMMAALIGFTLPFPLYATRYAGDRRWRWVAIGILFVLTLGLVLTFSRGAWVAVLLGIIIGAVLVDWRVLRVMAVVLVAAFVVASVTPRNILVSADELPPYAPGSGESPPDIFDSIGNRLGAVASNKDLRVRYVVEGMPILLDHPLLGVGPGRYGGAVARVIESPVYAEYDTSLYGFRTVHNFWLHLLGEVGAFGTAVFVALVVGVLVRLVKAARAAGGIERIVLGAASTVVVVVALNSFTEMLFEGNFPAFAVWMVLGFGSLLAPAVPLLARRGDGRPATTAAS